MVIAIDGPAGSGKTTTAKQVARKLGFIHINTGSMYRGIALKCIQKKADLDNQTEIEQLLNQTNFTFGGEDGSVLFMDGEDISSHIITAPITESVSRVSAIPKVREKLVDFQRKMAEGLDVILEGRDIGTVVFPNADFKFFLVAEIRERAKRRLKELEAKGEKRNLKELTAAMIERDRKDSTRSHSPLKKAEDAIEIDTSNISIEQQVEHIVEIINKSTK